MGTPLTWFKLALAAFFWAAMFHLGKYAVAYMSPLAVGGWRFLLAGALLLPLLHWREKINWAGMRRNLWPLLAMATIGICGFNIALFYGLRLTSPVNGALIVALNPAITTLFAALLMREHISGRQIVGLLLGLAGVATVVSHGSLHALLALSFTPGDLLVLLAAVGWAVYSVIPRRFIKGLAPLQITTATIAMGGVLMASFAQSVTGDLLHVPPLGAIIAVLIMSIGGSVLAYQWWNDSVSKIGPAKAALFMNLVPIFATLMGVVMGQAVTGAQLAGAALVIGGVIYASTKPRPAVATLPTGCAARQA
ncbi:Threonine/homoserine efflux transporter RhtA [Andreprevotia lacus DSM 23236]|jgi:drug/metabolite transporter (DMT)-like permease|uniref:Threonine/homoserine efflux transporter RhtA n=1 Tax=Andreprevotia lacus DSM 23236 TaxID=1121001 RepID=A0A1W1XAL9_9NEIS|nr:DMT family transporter [Andreprevotia lacus]SMC20899.1 Threonine/homoserine efflux transporter RhtA [Andreprevotia lacus DSM 23236]